MGVEKDLAKLRDSMTLFKCDKSVLRKGADFEFRGKGNINPNEKSVYTPLKSAVVAFLREEKASGHDVHKMPNMDKLYDNVNAAFKIADKIENPSEELVRVIEQANKIVTTF